MDQPPAWPSWEQYDNKNQPPPLDHLKNLLLWVDSIKEIPLGLVQYVTWALSRIPQLILAIIILFPK
jgi:hypothetical protein